VLTTQGYSGARHYRLPGFLTFSSRWPLALGISDSAPRTVCIAGRCTCAAERLCGQRLGGTGHADGHAAATGAHDFCVTVKVPNLTGSNPTGLVLTFTAGHREHAGGQYYRCWHGRCR